MSENKKGNAANIPSSVSCSSGTGVGSVAKKQSNRVDNLSISGSNNQDLYANLVEHSAEDFSKKALQNELNGDWTDKKKQSQALSCRFHELAEDYFKPDEDGCIHSEYFTFKKKSEKIADCGSLLEFKIFTDGVTKPKLNHANFCKDRLCPMCAWRKSLKTFKQVSQMIDYITDHEDEYGKVYFIFLTLTCRNCAPDALGSTLDRMYNGWRFLYHESDLFRSGTVLGTMRALEVTKNKKKRSEWYGTFHPHLHIMLAVNQDYFDKEYRTTEDFSKLWQKSMKLDYAPITYVERIYSKDGSEDYSKGIAEVSKYMAKGSDYVADKETVKAFYDGLNRRRIIAFTGILKDVRKKLKMKDVEESDLVHIDDDSIELQDNFFFQSVCWRAGCYVEV